MTDMESAGGPQHEALIRQPSPHPVAPLVGSRNDFIRFANRQEQVPWDEYNTIFDAIVREKALRATLEETNSPVNEAGARILAEGQEGRNRLVASHLSLVVSKAYERVHSSLPVEELIQIGCLLLFRAIDKFVELPDRQYFSKYAEVTIRRGLGWEISYNILGHRPGGGTLTRILDYQKRRQELEEARGRTISIAEMAEDLGISKKRAQDLDALSHREVFFEDVGITDTISFLDKFVSEAYAGSDEPDPGLLAASQAKKEILVERGLAVISPFEAGILRLHYGFDGISPRDTTSIAEEMEIRENTVQNAIRYGHHTLRNILPQINDGTFDYAAWQKLHPNLPKTVLTFLAVAGIPILPDRRLSELRKLGRYHMSRLM